MNEPTDAFVRRLYWRMIGVLFVMGKDESAAEAIVREDEMVVEIADRVDAHPRGRQLLESVLTGDIDDDEMPEAMAIVRGPRPTPLKTLGS